MKEESSQDLIKFTISFEGESSDKHKIDMYDVAQALTGFQRSLSLTIHLILNNKIITRSTALKNAEIYALPPEEGSWKTTAVICTALYSFGTAPQNTLLGHLVYSAYDYVISESLGVHVDYNKSIGQIYKEAGGEELPQIRQSQLDSIIEKCSHSIKEMHRPIYFTHTANSANIVASFNNKEKKPLQSELTMDTYEYLNDERIEKEEKTILGYISSYNINTFKGRIFVEDEGRGIPFELSAGIKHNATIEIIVEGLKNNALKTDKNFTIECKVNKITSTKGKLKSYIINFIDPNYLKKI